MEILYDQGIPAIAIHIQVNLINGNGICQRQTVKLYIAVKDFVSMGIRYMKSLGNRCGSFQKISICINNQHVSRIGSPSLFINKLEGLTHVIQAFRICASPAALFQDKN